MENIPGSVLAVENFPKLQLTKARLEIIKSYKLQLRDGKHSKRDHSLDWTMEHLEEEIQELREAHDKKDVENQLEEVADAINCLEIYAMMILY